MFSCFRSWSDDREAIRAIIQDFIDSDDDDVDWGMGAQAVLDDDVTSSSGSEEEFEEDDPDDERVPKNEGFFHVVDQFNDEQFIEHFRVSRRVAEQVANGFAQSDFFKVDVGGNGKLSPLQQTPTFLWFAGHQTASFRDVSDRFHMTKSSLFRVTRRLIFYLSGLSKNVIKWPLEEQKAQIADEFRRMGFLPNVIGAIDGCHIQIDRPSYDAQSYYNRKKCFSIHLQATCDHQSKFTSVYIGFPGSVHDARVFRRSPLGRNLEARCGNYLLIGDSAYPCSRHLLTPFKDNGRLTNRQKTFNKKLSRCRIRIEHSFGLLKQKFRQLYYCKLRKIGDLVHFIRACCVLHNIAVDDNFNNVEENAAIEEDIDEEMNENVDEEDRDAPEGVAFRNYVLTNNIFEP